MRADLMPGTVDGDVLTADGLRLIRAEDLLVARLSAVDCKLVDREDGPVLIAGANASLVLHLPPQHLGERAWPEDEPAGNLSPHRAAQATRLVYAVDEGTVVPFSLAGVLTLLPTLTLRVAPQARPGAPSEQQVVHLPEPDLTGVLARAATHRLRRGLARTRAATPRAPWERDLPFPLPPDGHVHFPPLESGPRPPTDLETAIEAPYRVTVSPSALGAFVHDPAPTTAPDDDDRTELWRTHLTSRTTDEQRIVRAIWSRDKDPLDANAIADPSPLGPQSLLPAHRRALVHQTSDDRVPEPPREPITVNALALSSLGAWVDWQADWDGDHMPQDPVGTDLSATLSQYRHHAIMGRDQYVRVAQPGFLYPFGHKALWVTVTERKVTNRADAVAYLRQKFFIVIREPVRSYGGHDSPWSQVAIEPIMTPNLDPAPNPINVPFLVTAGGNPFSFTLVATDRAGGTSTFPASLVFVSNDAVHNLGGSTGAQAQGVYAGSDRIPGQGRKVAFAAPQAAGDTTLEVNTLRFTGDVDVAGFTCRPTLDVANAVVPAMRHLAPQAPGVDLAFAAPFLAADAGGFGGGNPGQLFLKLAGLPPAMDFTHGSDRSGGLLSPNLVVRGLSRTLGSVGEDGTVPNGLSSGAFDPASFLAGALPKLFGLINLLDILQAGGIDLNHAPSFVTEALDAVSTLSKAADQLKQAVQDGEARLQAELAGAAHDGAEQVLQDAKQALDTALAPLVTALDDLLAAFSDLAGAPDLDAVLDAIRQALHAIGAAAQAVLDAVARPQIPMIVRAGIQRPLQTVKTFADTADATVAAVKSFVDGVLTPNHAVTARFEWTAAIQSWPADESIFIAKNPLGLRLSVEVQASTSGPPQADVAAELADFALQLLPGAPLISMSFSRIGFRVAAGGKPEVDVVFGGMEFLGALSFVDTLRRMIPFDGFSDPPYVDISPEGATAGFDLALPNVAVGVFSLENISLGANARVPFLGDAVTIGFNFCSKDSPFRLTVMCVGGGGWVALTASPKGLVLLDLGLEAAAELSVDLGVASGSVSVSVGVYLRLEGDQGKLTAYFRIRGEVDVLGLISASITLELSLTYDFPTGKLVGRASLTVDVEVLFFSASVEITVERKLAGSKGDPVLRDVLPPAPDGTNPDWSTYCQAFAPAA